MRIPFFLFFVIISALPAAAQSYPKGYFRNPLSIPMQLVANYGEIRPNHWHMGLDIRTQQKVNLPVYAAAEGYISRVSVEPGGFGQAIYINHPNGLTTVYGHLNAFFPALAQYVKEQQYVQEKWQIDLQLSPNQFPVQKGTQIALSGSTGGSQGPHVHFEIRDTKSEKVLNPLLFGFPITDNIPPSLLRLAMYDRNKSTYTQSPQLLNIQKTRNNTVRVGSDKISFAIGAVDRFTNSGNQNGIYSACVSVDGRKISEFQLDNIGYDETRYINAQVDIPYNTRGGGLVQHISPLPGARKVAYTITNNDGYIHLRDEEAHNILIEVKDAYGNLSTIPFKVQLDKSLGLTPLPKASEQLIPNNVNVIEKEDFELFTTEMTVYDTIPVTYSKAAGAPNAVSNLHSFLSAAFPSQDYFTVRVKPLRELTTDERSKAIIQNKSGTKTFVQKAAYQNGWLSAKFRQFGTYQAFVDNVPPTINGVNPNLSNARSIVFTPRDNFNSIKSFRAEVDGQWLRFTNDKGKTWIYTFDEHFPRGEHQLKVTVEDEAGNVITRVFQVKR